MSVATKLIVDRKVLLDALAGVMPAVGAGTGLALSGVRITADHGESVVEANNLDLGLRTRLDAKVDGPSPATVVISARKLRTVVLRGLPAGDVTITIDPKRPSVSAGSTTVWFDALPADLFPRWPEAGGTPVSLSAADVGVIKRLAVAASTDFARPILHAVCLADGWAAASDSFRLIAGRISATPERPVLLPLEAVRVLPDAGVELVVGAERSAWDGGYSRLVIGEFPHWQNLMPAPAAAPLVIDRPAFLAAVVRAEAVIAVTEGRAAAATPLRLVPVAGGIDLRARVGGDDLFGEELGLDAPSGLQPVAVNARFLADLLRAITGPQVRLSMRDALKPVLFTSDDDQADAFKALLMPVRIS